MLVEQGLGDRHPLLYSPTQTTWTESGVMVPREHESTNQGAGNEG